MPYETGVGVSGGRLVGPGLLLALRSHILLPLWMLWTGLSGRGWDTASHPLWPVTRPVCASPGGQLGSSQEVNVHQYPQDQRLSVESSPNEGSPMSTSTTSQGKPEVPRSEVEVPGPQEANPEESPEESYEEVRPSSQGCLGGPARPDPRL